MSRIKDERELLSKPGDTILETLEFMKMSQVEFAKRIGKTPSKVNDLISGKEPITVSTALQLENVLGIDAKFWLNREMEYRELLTRIEQEEALEECKDWLKQQPIKQLKDVGYIKSEKADAKMVTEFLQFYAVNTPVEWEKVYIENYASTSFRKSQVHSHALGSMAAWLRIGEIAFRNLNLPIYDKDIFKSKLGDILKLVESHPEDYAIQLQTLCTVAGVGVVYTINLPKAPISGATRWIGGNPLIQMTDRFKTNDQFWFTFFHEAGHICLHGKREVFIEDFEGYELDQEKENEADKFAADWLLSDEFVNELPSTGITEKDIRKIAKHYHTHPAIVLGRLQKKDLIKPSFGFNLRMKVVLDQFINKINL